MDPVGTERVDRHRGAERRIDAAGEPEHHARKAVLVDIVAKPEHAGRIVGLVAFLDHFERRLAAAPALAVLLPDGERDRLAERRHLAGERAVGVDDEGGAVEDELVLAADLVEIDERQPALGHAGGGDVDALVGLAAPVGRAVRDEEDLAAGLGDALDDLVAPDVLADRDADAHAADHHRPGQRARREHALLVEDAVVRQIDLEAQRRDLAAVEQRIGVVEPAVLGPGQPDEHRRPAVAGLARQRLAGLAADILEGGLQDEVLGRIAGEEELREHDHVGAEPAPPRRAPRAPWRRCRRRRRRSD